MNLRKFGNQLVALSLLIIVAGCDARRGGTVTQRDSAGVRIVESARPAWADGAAWRIADLPLLTIGAGAGDAVNRLNQPFSATRLSDGAIVIANWGTRELHWYDAQGQHLQGAGGGGTAPGRFSYLSWITRIRGDSILATDAGRPQLTAFSRNGALGRITDLPAFSGLARFTGGVADGGVLLSVSTRGGAAIPTELARDTFLLIHHDPSLPRTDTIGAFPGTWTYRQALQGGGMVAWSPPLRGHTTVATGGGRVYVGDADRGEVLVYEPAGRLRAIFRRVREPRIVDEETIREFRQYVQSTALDDEQRRMRAEAYEQIPFPETLPAFQSIAADSRGRVWVQEYTLPWESGPQRWSIFEPSGDWLGTIELPQRLVVLEVGESYVLGVWREESDAIRLYEIMR